MSTLLFPGRHLVTTRFQASYLRGLLGRVPAEVAGLRRGSAVPADPLDRIIFAVTSSNQENSRYNPVPFFLRAIGVDRFARELQRDCRFTFRLVPVPHYGHTTHFVEFTLKEIEAELGLDGRLRPDTTIVLCSTAEVSAQYQEAGFSIAPAEAAEAIRPASPIDVIRAVGDTGAEWAGNATIAGAISLAAASVFVDFPHLPERIARIYRDPLTNQEGGLTENRDYNTYARGMNEIVRLKYLDIRPGIRAGRIVDEGCADGALLVHIARDFPDSDLYGIDLSAEFAARFQERKRRGEFGSVYTCFFLRNLLDPLFEPGSVATTLCNSTLHELWSYGEQAKTVRAYLRRKWEQLEPGGRLIVRDVVGPESGVRPVLLSCATDDGIDLQGVAEVAPLGAEQIGRLNTRSRFLLFARDFLAKPRGKGARSAETIVPVVEESKGTFRVSLRTAAEFLSKKDYVDNWSSEMNEEFCFWDFPRWSQEMAEAGFKVLPATQAFPGGSRVYTNPWIVEHRYRGRARLLDDGGAELAFPPTNMVLVCEKA